MDKLSKKQLRLLEAATKEYSENNKRIVGFICKSMVIASIPHSKMKNTVLTKKNNNYTVTITGNQESGGLPYGTYPRLILTWIVTEVTRNKNRELVLGKSISDFMKSLGIQVSGGKNGTMKRFKDQLKRLMSSVISISYSDKNSDKFFNMHMSIADKTQITDDFYNSSIILGENFFNEILRLSIPVDLKTIHSLKDSSLALDIYFWLTYRFSYLKDKAIIDFENLFNQFSVGYKDNSVGRNQFKRKFITQLKNVLIVYNIANVQIKDKYITISPSITHISNKFIK